MIHQKNQWYTLSDEVFTDITKVEESFVKNFTRVLDKYERNGFNVLDYNSTNVGFQVQFSLVEKVRENIQNLIDNNIRYYKDIPQDDTYEKYQERERIDVMYMTRFARLYDNIRNMYQRFKNLRDTLAENLPLGQPGQPHLAPICELLPEPNWKNIQVKTPPDSPRGAPSRLRTGIRKLYL